jgi:hypothetical protein
LEVFARVCIAASHLGVIHATKSNSSEAATVLVTTLHLCDPSLFAMASLMGFDGIWLDMEHHGHSGGNSAQPDARRKS